ncbi:hypothetical protein QFZ81_005318 [Paenibacillus sp. V4I9]|nr:hypothetical protein [Paenibacillus sp. V4I9]
MVESITFSPSWAFYAPMLCSASPAVILKIRGMEKTIEMVGSSGLTRESIVFDVGLFEGIASWDRWPIFANALEVQFLRILTLFLKNSI